MSTQSKSDTVSSLCHSTVSGKCPPCLNYPSLEMPCSSIMTAAPRNARQNDRHCVPRRGPRDDPWHPPRGLRSTQDHSRHRSAHSVGAPLMRSKASTRPPGKSPRHRCLRKIKLLIVLTLLGGTTTTTLPPCSTSCSPLFVDKR